MAKQKFRDNLENSFEVEEILLNADDDLLDTVDEKEIKSIAWNADLDESMEELRNLARTLGEDMYVYVKIMRRSRPVMDKETLERKFGKGVKK